MRYLQAVILLFLLSGSTSSLQAQIIEFNWSKEACINFTSLCNSNNGLDIAKGDKVLQKNTNNQPSLIEDNIELIGTNNFFGNGSNYPSWDGIADTGYMHCSTGFVYKIMSEDGKKISLKSIDYRAKHPKEKANSELYISSSSMVPGESIKVKLGESSKWLTKPFIEKELNNVDYIIIEGIGLGDEKDGTHVDLDNITFEYSGGCGCCCCCCDD